MGASSNPPDKRPSPGKEDALRGPDTPTEPTDADAAPPPGADVVTTAQALVFGCSILGLWVVLLVALPMARVIARRLGIGLGVEAVVAIICAVTGLYLLVLLWVVLVRRPAWLRGVSAPGRTTCGLCRKRIRDGPDVSACPHCQTRYHARCWRAADVCSVCGRRYRANIPGAQPAASTLLKAPQGRRPGTCPYCQSQILPDESWGLCPGCGSPHHEDCWDHNSGCATYGCTHEPRR